MAGQMVPKRVDVRAATTGEKKACKMDYSLAGQMVPKKVDVRAATTAEK